MAAGGTDRQRVLVSLQCIPADAVTGDSVSHALHHYTPLRNLQWKSASRTRTINTLEVEFQSLQSVLARDASPRSQVPANLLDRPLLHMLFIVGDDNDSYRSTLRQQTRDWLDQVQTSKGSQEWLVVNVMMSAGSKTSSKFYSRKSGVIDKLKADFNVGKRDRCIQIALPEDDASLHSAEVKATWVLLTANMKESIIFSFEATVSAYEEDIRKADSQRQLTGWNFCTFYLYKEGLALSFEAMNLMEDALMQYEELEATYFVCLKDPNFPFMKELGAVDPTDDSASLLDTRKKPYRDLIRSNTITTFDFRCYLFGRQCACLQALGRFTEIAKRATQFISTFSRTLRIHGGVTLPPTWVESWIYASCADVINHCEIWADQQQIDLANSNSYMAVKAELLQMSLQQLTAFGILKGFVPNEHPFTGPLSSGVVNTGAQVVTTHAPLVKALQSAFAFDQIYLDLINRNVDANTRSGRSRTVASLKASAAALQKLRSNDKIAEYAFAQLPNTYNTAKWSILHQMLLENCRILQDQLNMPQERLLSTLALLRAGAVDSQSWSLEGQNRSFSPEDNASLASKLVEDIGSLSKDLNKDFAANDFPVFKVDLNSAVGILSEDGVAVEIAIESTLPMAFVADEVRIKLSRSHNDVVWLTHKHCQIKKCRTATSVSILSNLSGTYTLELSQIRVGRIIFQYFHNQHVSSISEERLLTSEHSKLVCFPRSWETLDVDVVLAPQIHLDRHRELAVILDSTALSTASATVNISIPFDSIIVDTEQAQMVEGDCQMTVDDGTVFLSGINTTKVSFSAPLQGSSHRQDIIVHASVIYQPEHSSQKRTIRKEFKLRLALPLAINVQDHFRRNTIISTFSVTVEEEHPLRLASLELLNGHQQLIESGFVTTEPAMVLEPHDPHDFIFRIQRPSGGQSLEGSRLVIKFRSVLEELKYATTQGILSNLQNKNLDIRSNFLKEIAEQLPPTPNDVSEYLIENCVTLSKPSAEVIETAVSTVAKFRNEYRQLVNAVNDFYDAKEQISIPSVPWSELSIPVDPPHVDVLCVASIKPNTDTKARVGKPLSAVVNIDISFSWSRTGQPEGMAQMIYQVGSSNDDWIVTGLSKGDFRAKEGLALTIPVSLIPTKQGHLLLPSLTVYPAPLQGSLAPSTETYHSNSMEQILVLPASAKTSFEIPGFSILA